MDIDYNLRKKLIKSCYGKSETKGGLNTEQLRKILLEMAPEREVQIIMSARNQLQNICIGILRKRAGNVGQQPVPPVQQREPVQRRENQPIRRVAVIPPQSPLLEPPVIQRRPQTARKSVPIATNKQYEVLVIYNSNLPILKEKIQSTVSNYDIVSLSPYFEQIKPGVVLFKTVVNAAKKRDIMNWLQEVGEFTQLPIISIHRGSPII
jgi:hypothetical protein